MAELISAIDEGWKPTRVREERDSTGTAFDVVFVEKDGQEKEFRSDHLAFHRYVEGLMEDHGLSYS
jgi:hypothetical protein